MTQPTSNDTEIRPFDRILELAQAFGLGLPAIGVGGYTVWGSYHLATLGIPGFTGDACPNDPSMFCGAVPLGLIFGTMVGLGFILGGIKLIADATDDPAQGGK
jgi:hypothetical protein